MTKFEDVLETILEEYARRDSEGEFDTWEETDAFVKEKAEVLLAYVKEEPVSKTPADIEAAMQEVEDKSRAFTEAHKGENADDILAQMRGEEPVSKQKLSNSFNIGKDYKEEPVSEELEEAMKHNAPNNIGIDDLLYWRNGFITGAKWQKEKEYTCYEEAFEDGAKWKAEQFEKNRLAACDRQTEEEAEIEREFVTSIIEKEHRQPTFDDAIKYGMRLQKEQFEKDYTDLCNGIATAKGLAVAMAYDKGMADAREQMINKFYDWLKSNATYIHPRKGTEECITTLGKLKQAMKDE